MAAVLQQLWQEGKRLVLAFFEAAFGFVAWLLAEPEKFWRGQPEALLELQLRLALPQLERLPLIFSFSAMRLASSPTLYLFPYLERPLAVLSWKLLSFSSSIPSHSLSQHLLVQPSYP